LSIVTTASPTLPSRDRYDSSTNFSLPTDWLSGQVTLTASLDPGSNTAGVTDANGMYTITLKSGTYTITPQGDTTSFTGKTVTLTNQDQTLNFSPSQATVYLPVIIRSSSSDPFNGQSSFTVTFTNVPDLDVKIVPINYTYNGTTYPAPTTDEVAGIKDYLKFRYPVKAVNVTVTPPLNLAGSPPTGQVLIDMLNQLAQFKANDGAPPSQVYYGISEMPSSVAGSAGRAFEGSRVGTGIDSRGKIAAHEIGHAFLLKHPCEDPNSPYQATGIIGVYGLNLGTNPPQVFGPNARSLMDSCYEPRPSITWLSDYEYQILYNDQLTNGNLLTAQATGDILAIRAIFAGDDEPRLQPVYAFRATPTIAPDDSAYAVELLNAEGQVLASHPVQLSEIGHDSDEAQPGVIVARVPSPSEAVATVRLLHNGQTVDKRPVASTIVEPTLSETADSLTVKWDQTTTPALVRYTTDGGATWNTIGLDVLGGELVVDRNALPDGDIQFQVVLGN
jgi:hypothetical protein